MAVGRFVAVTLAAALLTAACARHEQGPSTVTTRVDYDAASRRLTIACERSSSGTCHLRVGLPGQEVAVAVPQGERRVVEAVAAGARTCVGATTIDKPATCAWTAVGPA